MSEQQSFQSGGDAFTPLQTVSGKVLRTLPRAFQMLGAYGLYTYKFNINSSVLDAAPYKSRSGMSSRACYVFDGDKLTLVRGLWEISDLGVTYGYVSPRKITRDDLTDPQVVSKVFGPMITHVPNRIFIDVDNYGFKVYSSFRKCPTLSMLSSAQQGSLFVYRIDPMALDCHFELFRAEVEKHEFFNHTFTAKAVWGGKGIGVVFNDQPFDIQSTDHHTISLSGGAYIFTHHPTVGRRVD